MELNNLRTICSTLTSHKAIERKRAAEELMIMLDQEDEIVKTLEKNSTAAKSRNLFTWTDVFAAEEIYFEKETEKIHQNPQSVPQSKAQVLNVIVKTVKKSTGEKPFLPWFRIFNFITKYLEQPVYADIFGYSLTSMMISFLNHPLYVTLVQASSWSELIQLLLNMYGKHNIPVTTILECLNTAVKHGSEHPSVLSLLRTEVIPFYQKAFESPDKVKPYLVPYLKGLTVLCRKNSVDFRGMLCKLGELIIPKVLHSNCFNQDELNIVMVEFLTVQLQLHAPCDVKSTSPGFHAADTAKWFEIVGYIYSFCIDSIEDIANKKNSAFNKDLLIPDNLLLLAVKCTNQITHDSEEEDENGERPTKKTMTYKSFHIILEEVSKMSPSYSQLIWISYIAAVLSEFPELIESSSKYVMLAGMGSNLLNSVFGSFDEVYTLYRSLFICEKYFITKGLIYKHNIGTWDEVWNNSLKHLTSIKNKAEMAELLRCLLVEVQPSNINLLLIAFVNRSLPVTKQTLMLLCECLSRCALPLVVSDLSSDGDVQAFGVNKTICPRIALTRWLMTKLNETDCTLLPIVGSLLASLVVKRTHVLLNAEYNNKECFGLTRPYVIQPEEFEKKLLRITFTDPPVKVKIKTVEDGPNKWGTFKIVNSAAINLNEYFQADFETSIKLITPNPVKNSEEFVRNLSLVQSRLILQLNLVNMLQKYGIGINPEDLQFFKKNMETLLRNSCLRFSIVFTGYFSKDGLKETVQLTNSLSNMRKVFLTCHLCQQTKVFFSQLWPPEIEQLFKSTFRNSLNRHIERNRRSDLFFGDLNLQERGYGMDSEDSERNSNEIEQVNRASMEALSCIIDYSLICDERAAILVDVFTECLEEDFELGNQFIFDVSSELISRIAPILSLPSMAEIVPHVVTMVQQLCRGFHMHPRCTLRLWELCAAICGPIANSSDENKKKLMTLVGGLSTFLSGSTPNGTHINIHLAAFKTFNELLKHDRDLSWTMYTVRNSDVTVWVLKDAYLHLNNPSHQARISAADMICNIFLFAAPSTNLKLLTDSQLSVIPESTQPDDHLGLERKYLFEKLFPFIMETFFNIPVTLRSDERIEEGVNRTSIALFCLTRLIFAYPLIKKKSLICLFGMIHRKGIKVELACRALKQANPNATKTLCSHFSYIFNRWVGLSYALKDFPYQLFEYTNQLDFYKNFKRDICVHLFEYNSMGSLKDFAKSINIHHVDLIKECYGIIMARLIPALLITGPKHSKPTGPTEIYGRLLTILGGKSVTDEMMKENLGEITLHLISLCFNATVTSTWGCPSIKLPEPEVPYCSEPELLECLEYLMQKSYPGKGDSIISYLANSSPRSVYNILVTLAVRIHEAHDIMEKFYRLHHFSFFVGLLTQATSNVFNTMKEYVCHFVTYAYLRLLQGEDSKNSYFVRSVLFLLTEFIQFLARQCVSEAKIFMYPIVSSVVSLSSKYPHHLPVIKTLLDILILSPNLSQCIVSLDPFPSHIPEFQEYRLIYVEQKYGDRRDEWTLQRELQSILNEVSASGGHCTKERLDFIRDLLANQKREFEKLLTEMEDRKVMDNNSSEMVHRLIQMLVGVVLKSEDPTIVREACRCLGEIGPVDLGVLVLPQYSSKTKITSMINAISAIIEIVAGYMKSDDIYLVVTSGQVLTSILEVTECAEILDAEIKASKTRLGDLLKPFMSRNSSSNSPREILDSELESKLCVNEMDDCVDFPTWIKQLTCGMIECIRPEGTLPSRLLPLCTYKVEFCEDVLPFIVFVVLYAGKSNPMIRQILSNYFRNFIGKFVQHLYGNNMDASHSLSPSLSVGGTRKDIPIYVNKLALRSLLKCIHFLRLHTAPLMPNNVVKFRPSPWENNFCLDVDYMDLAKAAQYCGAYLTSVLYVEISAMESEMRNSEETTSTEAEQFYSQNTSMYPRNRNDLADIEILLLKAYTKIGEEDAVYGCGSALFLDFQSNIKHLEQRQQWNRVLAAQDSDCSGVGVVNDVALCRPLKELGLFSTLWTYLDGVQSRDKANLEIPLSEIQYECGWRLSKWTINNDKASYIKDSPLLEKRSAGTRFHKFIYESIQAGLSNDPVKHLESIQKGLESIVIDLKHASLESSENIYGYLSRFQLFRVVEDFFSTENDQWIDKLMFKWKLQDKMGCSHFKYQEPFLYLRSALVHSLSLISNNNNNKLRLANAFAEFRLDLLAKARDASRLELAENCAVALGTCEKTTRKELEIAKNHWARGEQDTATHMLRKLIRRNNPETTDLFANILLLYGDWLSETMSERPIVILKKYLLNACTILESDPGSPPKEIARANFVVAKYVDTLYQNVTRYMRSELFQEKLRQFEKATEELHTNVGSTDQDTRRSALVLRKQSNIEQEEIQTTVGEKKKFLLLALRHYLRGLSTSNENDLLIFRAVALWLENNIPEEMESQVAAEANKVFSEENLPTYKYIVVLHQLSARMGSGENAISKLLNELLIKCAQEHPLHTLPVLLTQSLLHKDQEVAKSRKQVEDRVTAAAKIVEVLKKDRSLSTLMIKMEKLWIALIHLANQQDQKNTDGLRRQMSSKTSLLGLKALDCVAVPTVFVPVSPTGEYKDSFVGINGFESFYNLVGGINSPKRICCMGTNGLKYNMLLKGQDDLRQDAVMQQVFGVMNKLLIADSKTKTKRLTVRTYKVVPLSQRSGIIEWCENTQTFGDYLVGSDNEPGAHALYRPNDYKPIDCRRKMNEVKDCREHLKKLKVYLDIAEKFKPVFRHFFFEKFKDAGIFFERRLAYTRSVATSSMVGYILGLGDRHVLNILIDKTTAELIHIDLGVAFEQGRILPTPETIPFRLTRDIVDGMGVSGVEGVFRKSCELTLEVLRNNSEIILTILEVLLYDPLYIWTLTADRVQKVQPAESSTALAKSKAVTDPKPGTSSATENAPPVIDMRNNSAARVLLRLKQKLVGIEEGFSSGSSLSVPGHVTLLIQRAMDPERLCRLFPGWQPYL